MLPVSDERAFGSVAGVSTLQQPRPCGVCQCSIRKGKGECSHGYGCLTSSVHLQSPSYARARRKRPSKRMNPLWRSSSFHKTLPDADSQPAVLPRNPPASAPDTPADSPPASPPAYPTALGFMVNLGTTSCAANAGTSATPTPPSSFSDNDTVILDSADFDNSTGTGGFAQIPWAPGRRFSRIQAQQAMDLEPRGSPPNL